MKKTKEEVMIDGMRWSARELAQIIRRKMITRGNGDRCKYSRKEKHKTVFA